MKAVIFGVSGTCLSVQERAFFEKVQPLGFILFRRNCKTPEQILALVADLKSTVAHRDVPILIDQEGGRVMRLHPPHFRASPPAQIFGKVYQHDSERALALAVDNYTLIAQELTRVGVNTNCAPCSDLIYKGASSIIGDRAFSDVVDVAASLSAAAIKAHFQAGVMPVIKHLPGHGRACVDSHEELPWVDADSNILTETDFAVFKRVLVDMPVHPWGMTAHIIYKAYDDRYCATESSVVIKNVIRDLIGFKGFLISDCLGMNALSGGYVARAERAMAAGCDAVIYCPGDLGNMMAVADGVPDLTNAAYQRSQMRPADFGVLPYASDDWLKRDALCRQGIHDFELTWKDQISTIGENNHLISIEHG